MIVEGNQKQLFDTVSFHCSRITTQLYSTSFSWGILCLDKSIRNGIYSIYGFVRYADEIVDSFHKFDQKDLLTRFELDTYLAIRDGISLNPILNSFQWAVKQYKIENALIDKFLQSMRMDLSMKTHDKYSYQDYVLGSAEVVGLMCLRVFCQGDLKKYEQLKPNAMKLGAAFQKINFLRDINADYNGLGRSYFPEIDLHNFNEDEKEKIIREIADDFHEGYKGIVQLPAESRFGVYIAYVYYLALFKKIKNTPSRLVMKERIRIRSRYKMGLLILSFFRYRLNLI
ncbi:MAG TPA: phytoene/squalene synthase family protein [Cyclobacteriaceae bacterium]|jgi:phytoene/squalene synthetase|nr:phytoene/squalene synthase family protein [Cyclobacteriaceae bacterium]